MNIRTFRYFVNVLAIAGALGYLSYRLVYPALNSSETKTVEIGPASRDTEQAERFEQLTADAIWLENHITRFGDIEIDLREKDRVYTAEKYFPADRFIQAFSRASWMTRRLEVDIIISDDTDMSFLRKLKSQLNRQSAIYNIYRIKSDASWKSGYDFRDTRQIEADDPEIIELTLTSNDKVEHKGKIYTLSRFLSFLDKESQQNTIRLIVVVTTETSDDFLSKASGRFFNQGHDYELDFR